MNIFKALFGSKEETGEERKREEQARNFDVLKYDGVRALRMRQYVYAVQCFTHALDLADDLECRDYLSQALIQTNDMPAAYEQLQKMAEAEPDNARIMMRMAEVAYMMENYNAMGDACERAMLIDNANAATYLLYARACRGQGDATNAVAMLTKAVALDADCFDAYLLRGEVLLEQGDVDAAAEDVDYLQAHVADTEDILLLKARVAKARGDDAQTVDIYNKVIELDPFSIVAYRERGEARRTQGDESGAQADLEMAAKLEAESAEGGSQDIDEKVRQAYRNVDPYGLSGNG